MESTTSEGAERIRELLERVVAALDLDAGVQVVEDEATITGTVTGEDLGLLIGRHGQTIDSLQHLAWRIAARGVEEPRRVVIDAAGYRERRAEILHRQADEAADDAARLDRPVPMEAVSPAERRVVHEYLRDRADVDTHSEGEGTERHLVVTPTAPL